MVVQYVSTIQRWIGLSTDTKPAAPTYVGSEFYETDTGRTYIWTGAAWVIKPIAIYNVQGGAYTIQDLMEQFQSMPDLARSPQSGSYTFINANEITIYEETDIHPFNFHGGYIDWTGCVFGGGEATTVTVYLKIVAGGTYRIQARNVYLAAALPVPILTPVPRDVLNALTTPIIVPNMYGVKVTVSQAAIGAGWNTISFEFFDSKRGG